MLEEAIKSVSVKRVLLRLLVGFLVALLLPLRGAVVRGQEIGVEAPESVYVGQQFQVTFVLSGKPKEFKEPDWGKDPDAIWAGGGAFESDIRGKREDESLDLVHV